MNVIISNQKTTELQGLSIDIIKTEQGEFSVEEIVTKYQKIRLKTTQSRDIQTLEKLVNDKFMEGTHFIHDGWSGYT